MRRRQEKSKGEIHRMVKNEKKTKDEQSQKDVVSKRTEEIKTGRKRGRRGGKGEKGVEGTKGRTGGMGNLILSVFSNINYSIFCDSGLIHR